MLPDVLDHGLSIVFCGTAAGSTSAAKQQYYAGAGNRFWDILFQAELTKDKLNSILSRSVLHYKLGLTDLVKGKSGMDATLNRSDFDHAAFREKILHYKPKLVCFNGKKAAEEYLGHKVSYGLQPETIGDTKLYVAPSTSRAANGSWDAGYWHKLKDWL